VSKPLFHDYKALSVCPLDVVFMRNKTFSRRLISHSFINEHTKRRHRQFIKLSTRENHFICAINYRRQSKSSTYLIAESSSFFESCQQCKISNQPFHCWSSCLLKLIFWSEGRLNDQTSSMTLNFQQISDLYLMNNNIILGKRMREATNAKCTAMPLSKHLSICTTPKMRWKRTRIGKRTTEKCAVNESSMHSQSFVYTPNTNCILVRFV
jgi:hypothetical protein